MSGGKCPGDTCLGGYVLELSQLGVTIIMYNLNIINQEATLKSNMVQPS